VFGYVVVTPPLPITCMFLELIRVKQVIVEDMSEDETGTTLFVGISHTIFLLFR